jgi:peptidoglycan/LPS O-acetylase OafA/YrhL
LNLLQNRYPALHGLRVLAILTVLQVHVTAILKAAGLLTDLGLQTLSEMVWYGMDLFFVLSGFLIGSMLLHNEATGPSDGSFGGRAAGLWRFWKRRAFRTFPLYYLVLTALLLVPSTPRAAGTTALEYLYLTNYLPNVLTATMPWAWSLCVEEHFYLLVPFLVLGVSVVKRPTLQLLALAALWASCLAVRLALWHPRAGSWSDAELFLTFYPRTHTRYDTLVVGVALAFAQRHYEGPLRRFFARWWARAGTWALVLGCLGYLMIPPPLRPREV